MKIYVSRLERCTDALGLQFSSSNFGYPFLKHMFPNHAIQKDLLSIYYFDREQGFCQIGEGSRNGTLVKRNLKEGGKVH